MKKELLLKASAEKIFFALSDVEEQKKWIIGLDRIEFPEGDGVGKPFLLYLKEGNKINKYNGVTNAKRDNEYLEVTSYNDYFENKIKYTLEKVDNTTTKLIIENEIVMRKLIAKIIWFMAGKLLSYFMLKIMFSKFKNIVESK